MPESKHRRKGRTRRRVAHPSTHGRADVPHPGCAICEALARDDPEAAYEAFHRVPDEDSDEHRVLHVGHPDGTEDVQLLAHGSTWSMEAERFDASVTCPVCDVPVGY